MTPEELRELDRALAKNLFQLLPTSQKDIYFSRSPGVGGGTLLPHYSTDRNDAEKVTRKMKERGFDVQIESVRTDGGARYRAKFTKGQDEFSSEPLLNQATAIAHAAARSLSADPAD